MPTNQHEQVTFDGTRTPTLVYKLTRNPENQPSPKSSLPKRLLPKLDGGRKVHNVALIELHPKPDCNPQGKLFASVEHHEGEINET